MMWFFNFWKKGKGEEPGKTEATGAKVSSANPNDVLHDIARSIRYARYELEHAKYYMPFYTYIIEKLDDAEEKCNSKQIWDVYDALDDAIRLLEGESLHQWIWCDDCTAYDPLSDVIRELHDAQLKCYRIW